MDESIGKRLKKLRIENGYTQNQIAEYLKHKCRKVDKIIEQRGKIIETLQKYKKSIVYEVVTGKREVL